MSELIDKVFILLATGIRQQDERRQIDDFVDFGVFKLWLIRRLGNISSALNMCNATNDSLKSMDRSLDSVLLKELEARKGYLSLTGLDHLIEVAQKLHNLAGNYFGERQQGQCKNSIESTSTNKRYKVVMSEKVTTELVRIINVCNLLTEIFHVSAKSLKYLN